MRTVTIGPVSAAITAPPALVYEMLAAIGQGPQEHGERAEIITRDGDVLVCDFWTRLVLPLGNQRLIRTRERVTLAPPDRIEYEHLDGPVRGLRESIVAGSSASGGTRLTYVGTYRSGGILGHLRALVFARPAIQRVMREHFEDVRGRAEARARRSRVFPAQVID